MDIVFPSLLNALYLSYFSIYNEYVSVFIFKNIP